MLLSQSRGKRDLIISFQGKKKLHIFKIIVPFSGLLLALASSPGGAFWVRSCGGSQASRLSVLGPEAKGDKEQKGASLVVSQDPSGDLGLFLNPFLPLLARAGCQERQGKQWVGPGRPRSPSNDGLSGAAFHGHPLHADTVQGPFVGITSLEPLHFPVRKAAAPSH